MTVFEIVVHPIIVREDTENREEIISLLDRIQGLTGQVEKRTVRYPDGCVSRSNLELFATANGYLASDAADLWAILLRDRELDCSSSRMSHHGRMLLIRHTSGELRHNYLARLIDQSRVHDLLQDLDLWIIHAGSLRTNAPAIVRDKPRGLGSVRIRLLQEWVHSLSNAPVNE